MADLFETGPRQKQRPGATPAPIGSGPDGETCRTCQFYVRVGHHDAYHPKCKLMESLWTHGPGSDISQRFAACREWKPLPLNPKDGAA